VDQGAEDAEQLKGGGRLESLSGALPLRVLGAALALIAAGIHFALSLVDLIPDEPTRGLGFALMGLGYVGCAVALFGRRMEYDVLVLLYSVGLVIAYAASRGDSPIEAIGLTSKAAEIGLAAVTIVLLRRR
jgi:hypothetical protein